MPTHPHLPHDWRPDVPQSMLGRYGRLTRGILLTLHVLAFIVVSMVAAAALGAYSGNHIAHQTSTVTALEWSAVGASVATLVTALTCFFLWRRRWARVLCWTMLLAAWSAQLGLIAVTHSLKY